MRKLAILAALATTSAIAVATPASARDKAWYVGVDGGAMIVENMHYRLNGVGNAIQANHKYGFDVDGVVGYDFGGFRLEGEVGYKQAYIDELRTGVAIRTPDGVTTRAANYNGAGGKTSALSFMMNGMLDFGPDDGISGFVGGGVGVARVKADRYSLGNSSGTSVIDDSDSRFAYQAIAGVRAPLNDRIDVGIKYRFFNAARLRYVATNGQEADSRFRSHSLMGSLTFNFGEPAAPRRPAAPAAAPPPPEVPPPPPPPPAPVGPFIVFFDWDKSDITTEAAGILDNAAQAYQQTGQTSIMLAGHADRSGSDQYNMGLSQRRADAVKAYLAGKGISDSAITTQAFGESRPLVQTADGVREPQNRRVEITFGPGSGQ